jgi:hypothetical protein
VHFKEVNLKLGACLEPIILMVKQEVDFHRGMMRSLSMPFLVASLEQDVLLLLLSQMSIRCIPPHILQSVIIKIWSRLKNLITWSRRKSVNQPYIE